MDCDEKDARIHDVSSRGAKATVILGRSAQNERPDHFCYVVTDIETDGPEPGTNAMRTFASVMVDQRGEIRGQFEGCLAILPESRPNPDTLDWLKSQPEVWADIIRNPRPASEVIAEYVDWIRRLPRPAVFVAHPISFDGIWMDWYLRKFAGLRLVCGPYGGERLFLGAGIDLPSLVMGTLGWEFDGCKRELYPRQWFGGHPHSHRAIDDAMGYARVLSTMLQQFRHPPHVPRRADQAREGA